MSNPVPAPIDPEGPAPTRPSWRWRSWRPHPPVRLGGPRLRRRAVPRGGVRSPLRARCSGSTSWRSAPASSPPAHSRTRDRPVLPRPSGWPSSWPRRWPSSSVPPPWRGHWPWWWPRSAALAAVTGLCVGCEIYVGWVRLRGGVRLVAVDRAPSRRLARIVVAPPGRRMGAGGDALRPAGRARRRARDVGGLHHRVLRGVPLDRGSPSRRSSRRGVQVVDVAEELSLAARYRVRRAPRAAGRCRRPRRARLAGADAVQVELRALAGTVRASTPERSAHVSVRRRRCDVAETRR